jgi:hypothetical protein
MKDEYDLFEKFSDGSSLWRDSVPGFKTARFQLQELSQRSQNQFYGINLRSGEVLVSNSRSDAQGLRPRSRTERRRKSQAA